MSSAGWSVTGWVAHARASRIGHARRLGDGTPALLKVSTGDPTLFREEYTLLRALDVPGVVRPHELTIVGAVPAMVLDAREVVSLAELLAGPAPDVTEALRIAHSLAGALAGLHAAGIVHGDLRPANILVERATGTAWVADLSAAVERRRAGDDAPLPAVEDWAWVAPEQTGRMDRPVDHRADFYTLGLLLYAMLTGRAPFEAADALDWAHAHAARLPAPPSLVAPQVPSAVSGVVLKLLAKTAEQRYRRAEALQADLAHCLAQWEAAGRVDPFNPGAQDEPDAIDPPRRLHGRERELAALLHAHAVSSGRARLVLVSGAPGIGKTALVQALREEVSSAQGHFVAAKFDSQRRDVSYATLTQALRELVRQVLALPQARMADWRAALGEALGASAQLMVDIVPALAEIIGPQPPLPDVGPAEARNRLRWVVGRFLSVFARPAHPLVLFLDDLQWADVASLALVRELLTGGQTGALLLVGTYRHEEVDAAHPLTAMLEQAQAEGAVVTHIALAPLESAHVAELVADCLQTTAALVAPLAALLHERTQGNPYYILQFLAGMRAEGLLRFDVAQQRWTWELDRARMRGLAGHVVHLVAGRLRRLPQSVREVLQHAACLGSSGRVALVAAAQGCAPTEVERALGEAARAGLVACHQGRYRFLHDRVQEAAYAQIPPGQRAAVHLRIGRLLLDALTPRERQRQVFEVVNQLNHGAVLVADPDETLQLARLNAVAGRRAKAGLSFTSAHDYLSRAAAAWPADGWQTHPDETFALMFDLAESEFLVARFQDADTRLQALLARARHDAERARICGLRIRVRLAPGQFGAAADVALDALRLFGVSFPEGDVSALLQQERAEIQRELAGRSVDDLLHAPAFDDARARTVLALMVGSFTAVFIARPAVFPLLVLKATRLVLQHGNCPESAVVYTYYARVLLAVFGEIAPAYEYSQLAVRLNDRLDDRLHRGMLLFSHAGFIHFWRQPFASGRPILDRAFSACLEVGNFVHAGLTAVNIGLYMAESGERLDELAAQAERSIAFLQATHSGGTLEVMQVYRQFARCLRGQTMAPACFDEDGYAHAAVVQRMVEQNSVAGLGIVHMLEQVAAFVAGDLQAALEAAGRTQGVLRAVHAMAVRPTYVFFHALTLAALHDSLPQAEREANLRAITQHAADLDVWAGHCPENYRTRHALVQAELARLHGHELEAERRYEQAIEAARAGALAHHEALACERAAAFHRARGFGRIAHAYLSDAHAAYARWGALGKVQALQAQHPALRVAAETAVPIDTLAVVRATQALSSQIDLAALLDTLMRIALEQAGAQAGRLYVTAGQGLELAASAEVQGEALDVQVLPTGATVHDDDGAHPGALLNVVRRSREPVLLGDATQPHPYVGDAWLQQRQPRSVLCVPLLRQSQVIGVLYLEHRLMTHAFTARQAALLGMLAGQAAISLETARLYQALKEENAQRRRAEAASREWQARIGRLLDSNIIAVRISDMDGRVVDANDAYLHLVGYTRADMAAGLLTTWSVTPPEYHAVDKRAREELLRHGRYVPYEKEYVRKDGRRVPVLAGGILFEGDPPQTVGFALDLSERQRAESERRARLAAEAANEAKSAFLANMSHELRTPLNAVLGYAQLLRMDDNLTDRQRRRLSTIESSGEHLLALINDVLDLARIEAGHFDLAAAPLVLRDCVAFVADVARVRAETKGLAFVVELQPTLPHTVHADERRLRQVLLNLLGNAVKFTRSGGVTLRVSGRPHEGASWLLAFEVEDTGVGMSSEEVARVFSPFEQAGGAQQRAEGAGLGLPITDALVRQMGGAIRVRSEPGRGSVFSFELVLPVVPAAGGAVPGLPVVGYEGPRRRVLIVDDVDENRAVLVELLKSLDFHTAEAAGGAQALSMVDALRPHLVLIDNGMPQMSGSEVTRELRTHDAFARIPIIAVSAGASAQEQASCLAAGADAFLPKPVDVAELLRTIGDMLALSWTMRSPPG